MFLITVKGKQHIWENGIQDDFLQFLPKHFGCDASEIEVEYINEAGHVSLRAEMQKGDRQFEKQNGRIKAVKVRPAREEPPSLAVGDDDPDDAGKKVKANDPRTKKRVIPEEKEELVSVKLHKLVEWPYEGKRFKGNRVED
jgi:hypothetical protein